ncbi:acyl-CoA thioesterase II [Mycobacterium sp. 1274761.0]|uniref:acyl-CoA thioesterase n=1 Tax=Mycobacterium sp. 1274761.0 TaxID=1834077 RepID=UPI00080129F6|nr:acyl-CoA thioesterase domain-containing protein [Mycobacterium sp. 1274761.0]OBK72399.1 acyl-CoA thioesterase II [Mycobacterium sp. 1274761.0]
MSRLLGLLELESGADDHTFIGPASGPEGKRAFGGQFMAQSLAAACATVEKNRLPTNMHLQFLRGGAAGEAVEYTVTPVFDGRTASARRVDSRQGDRLLTTASLSFAVELPGPEHGHLERMPGDPNMLPQSGPAGPAPSMPLEELDIRIADTIASGEFVRRFWWRAMVPLPDDLMIHTLVAVYVTDVYMIDPALQVHGHSMEARTHRSGTTDSSIWFHQPVRANEWNLLETRSPAAARGRGVVTGRLVRTDGVIAATLVQEGLIAERGPDPQ